LSSGYFRGVRTVAALIAQALQRARSYPTASLLEEILNESREDLRATL
jgi:GAF domain-containing protein